MVFQVRWILWALGVVWVVAHFFCQITKNRGWGEIWAKKNYSCWLFGVSGIFLVLAFFGKLSQLFCLRLHAQDFWLFVDILEHLKIEHLKKGGVFLTHFAPQAVGLVQHGSVHPMLSWGLLAPFVWVFGALPTALFFGPVMLTLAGIFLALLTRKNWGELGSLLFMIAFFASTQVGRVLMYEVHPEAAYPCFVLLWLWSMGWDGGKDGPARVRWGWLVFSIVVGMGIKEDAFLVFGPLIVWGVVFSSKGMHGMQKRAAILSLGLATSVFLFQMKAVEAWTHRVWGPQIWEGYPVVVDASAGLFPGVHWGGFQDVGKIIRSVVSQNSSLGVSWVGWGVVQKIAQFWVSRPWWSLLILAPWVLLRLEFWWFLLPLACVTSLLEGPRFLWNYYSAPFLGSFWFCAALVPRGAWFQKSFPFFGRAWVLGSALLLGSQGITWEWPTNEVWKTREEVRLLLNCLDSSLSHSLGGGQGRKGLVASELLGLVPLRQVWSDRFVGWKDSWEKVDFVLVSSSTFGEIAEIKNHLGWQQVGLRCELLDSGNRSELQGRKVFLFLKKSKKS